MTEWELKVETIKSVVWHEPASRDNALATLGQKKKERAQKGCWHQGTIMRIID